MKVTNNPICRSDWSWGDNV